MVVARIGGRGEGGQSGAAARIGESRRISVSRFEPGDRDRGDSRGDGSPGRPNPVLYSSGGQNGQLVKSSPIPRWPSSARPGRAEGGLTGGQAGPQAGPGAVSLDRQAGDEVRLVLTAGPNGSDEQI